MTCPVCGSDYTPTRSDQRVCSATCRQRKRRGTYVLTEADRAAIKLAAERVPIPVPVHTREQVEAHVAATAVRT